MMCRIEICHRFVPLILALGCAISYCPDQAAGQDNAQSSSAGNEWITDPAGLLAHLKQRDAEFDNRTLQIDERWTERVSPRTQIASQNRSARQLGQPADIPLDSVPEDFDQPHRVRQLLTVRGVEVTLDREAELETMKHPQYTALENSGHRWSSVGGVERSYSPETKLLHLMGKPQPGTLLSSKQRMFQWCCGYGFARQMESIDSVRVEGKSLLIIGKARLIGYDDSRVELALDSEYIVRKASVFVPAQNGDGGNLYVIETEGTVRPSDSPPLAKTGHFKRILQPGGKPERVYQELDVDFVSVSGKLSDPQYSQRTKIDPVDDVRVIDFRPRDQR
jgi:hypothetical protein